MQCSYEGIHLEQEQQEINDIANISSSLLSCILLVVNSQHLDALLKQSFANKITLLLKQCFKPNIWVGMGWGKVQLIGLDWTFRNWIQKEDNKRQTGHILGQYVNIVWSLRQTD